MDDLGLALIIFIFAFLAESMTEYLFGKPLGLYLGQEKRDLILPYIAAGVGVLMAYNWSVDFFGGYLGLPANIPLSGEIATGLIIGRGANWVHDFFDRIVSGPKPAGRTFRLIE